MADDMLSLRELRALRATVQHVTITRAARALGVSQPAVSRSLSTLEAKLGKTLFERRGRQVVPTPEALTLNAALDALFTALNKVNESAFVARSVAPIRVISSPLYAGGFLQAQFAALRATEPDLCIEVEVMSSRDMPAALADGDADLALTDADFDSDTIASEVFTSSSAVCLLPAGHRLAGRPQLAIEDLAGEPFVALARGHSNRKRIDQFFAGNERDIVADASTSFAAIEFVRHGIGLTILNPFPIIAPDDPDFATVPLVPRLDYHGRAAYLREKPLSAEAHRLVAQLRAAATRLGAPPLI